MRLVVVVLLLVLLARDRSSASDTLVKLVNNSYEGVVIGISPEIDESQGIAIIDALKGMIKEASGHLFNATRKRASFGHVTILIPQSWNNTPVDQAASREKYQESNIRVDLPHPAYRTQPRTVQPGGCGEPGEYIHLTPEYLTVDKYQSWWGRPGKTLVPRWAELRWGVFDEMGYPADPQYPLFHPVVHQDDNKAVTYMPNYCANAKVTGEIIKMGSKSGSLENTLCRPYGGSRYPESHCRFYPDSRQNASSSLMSYGAIRSDSLVEFCDSHTHLGEVPNKQNVMCQRRSVWEVMLEHRDFSGGNNPARTTPPEEPAVTVVREEYPSYVLVMDYSGSMLTDDRIENLQRSAVAWLLHTVVENSFVAIVRFSTPPARVLAPLTKITDMASRKGLAGKILKDVEGTTSIGSGLVEALKILEGQANKNIVLISDGEETESPTITDVMDQVLDANICVITVAIGDTVEDKLETLAEKTGCKAYSVNINDQRKMLNDAFESTLTRVPARAARYTHVRIYESPTHKVKDLVLNGSFIVERNMGRNLVFHLETDNRHHVIGSPRIIDPDGHVTSAKTFDDESLIWTVPVPLAKVGTWKWEVELDGDDSHWVEVFVTSQVRDVNDKPITLTGWASAPPSGVNATKNWIKLFAEVKQGNNPVVGAVVTGIVTHPGNVDAVPVKYILKDTGLFADGVKNDGIYTAYMTNFSAAGRYSYRAEVTNSEHAVITQRRRRRSPPHADVGQRAPCCEGTRPVSAFTRVSTTGSFKVTGVPGTDSDILPPGRVRDLVVKSVLPNNSKTRTTSITLTWTTPGDDLDQGIVSSYTFRLSPHLRDLSETQFDRASPGTLLTISRKDFEDYSVFLEGGTEVTFNATFKIALDLEQLYFVGLRAMDDSGNTSQVSNVVKFTVEEKLEMP